MPVVGLTEPGSLQVIPLDQAVEYFDGQGVFPADLVATWVQDFKDRRSEFGGELISPSLLSPDTTCRRQVFIERFWEYAPDIVSLWSAMEGTIYHAGINTLGQKNNRIEGVEREVLYPNESHLSHPLVKVIEGKPRVEVFPGVWMRGMVDYFSQPEKTVIDYKTTRATTTDYADKQSGEWGPQINVYAYLIEILRDLKVENLWVWRTYRGAYEPKTANRKIPIAKVERDDLWLMLKSWVEPLLEALKAGNEIYNDALAKGTDPKPALAAIVKRFGMEGESMFRVMKGKNAGGCKCTLWCSVRPICYQIEGRMDF